MASLEVQLRESPLSGTLFVFRNKSGNALKLLLWSHGGFLLVYKKLERGRFCVPTPEADRLSLTPAEVVAILEGIDLQHARRLKRSPPSSPKISACGATLRHTPKPSPNGTPRSPR